MNSKKTDIKRSNEENDRTITEALLAVAQGARKIRLDMADEMYRGMDSGQVFNILNEEGDDYEQPY